MKRTLLLFITLSFLECEFCYADGKVCNFQGGIRSGSVVGLEAGLTLWNRVGVKGIAQADWLFFSNRERPEKVLGKTYRLMYGGGLLIRIAGPVWMSLDAGYGWRGKYAWDEIENRLGADDYLQGLDVGIDIQCNLGKFFYLSIGYETIPIGFKQGKPVHDVVLGVGMRF